MNLIKIDRSTIRKNPDYEPGGFTKQIPVAVSVTYIFIGEELPGYLKMHSYVLSDDGRRKRMMITNKLSPASIEMMMNDSRIMDISMEREFIDVTTINEPEYLYSYIPTEIECLYCNAKFLHTELLSDSSSKSDYYSDEICPHCGDWNCCDIEYEELTNDKLESLIHINKTK